MRYLFVAIPAHYRPTQKGVQPVKMEAESPKEFPGFALANPAVLYTITDLDDPDVKLGGARLLSRLAGKATADYAYEANRRAQVKVQVDAQTKRDARVKADFKTAQLNHEKGCPYRLLKEHERFVCTCGYQPEETVSG
jgi:hypothetical protein